jgi:hypothetical protein
MSADFQNEIEHVSLQLGSGTASAAKLLLKNPRKCPRGVQKVLAGRGYAARVSESSYWRKLCRAEGKKWRSVTNGTVESKTSSRNGLCRYHRLGGLLYTR